MFMDKEMAQMHRSGIAIMTVASIAITLPFIFYAKDIADSLRVIAAEKRVSLEKQVKQSC